MCLGLKKEKENAPGFSWPPRDNTRDLRIVFQPHAEPHADDVGGIFKEEDSFDGWSIYLEMR